MEYVTAAILAIALVSLCITVHYEALRALEKLAQKFRLHRWMVLITMYGLLLAHVIEVWIFGVGYYVAEHWLAMGTISSVTENWFDYIYYSAMVYTTVGFGDMVPSGGARMLSSTEALAGLALITWSASFTFLQMQRLWRD